MARAIIALATIGIVWSAHPVLAQSQTIAFGRPTGRAIGSGNSERDQLNAVVGAWEFPNGEIAVVDVGGGPPMRTFSREGKFVRVIAASGSGPGELGPTLFAATRSGDSVITHELSGAKVSVFDMVRRTASAAALTLRNSPGRAVVHGMLSGQIYFVVGAPSALRPHDDGAYRDTTWFGTVAAGRDSVHVVGRVARAAFYANNKVPGPANLQRVRYDSLVPWTTFLAQGDRIIVADPSATRIAVYSADGRPLPGIEIPFPAQPYNRAELQRALGAVLATAKTATDTGMRRGMYDLAGRGPNAPRFKRVIGGPGGELWVERFWLDERAPREFAVLDPSGKLVARVTGAPPARFVEFGRDYALAVEADADGVQTVVRYPISRTQR